MLNNKMIRKIAIFVCICLSFGSVNVAFAKKVDPSIVVSDDPRDNLGAEPSPYDLPEDDEDDELLDLNEEDSVKEDTLLLNIGFTKCVSRDLPLASEGKYGSKITWKSSNPKVITDEGKYIKPDEITDVRLTATISKGKYKRTKSFDLVVNRRSIYDVMMDYVDTMLEYGRDDHLFTAEEYRNAEKHNKLTKTMGKNIRSSKSGLFFSMLERDTLKYPAYYVTDWPRNGYNSDERGSGCETSPEIWLYEMLYDLTAMTGDESYAKVADDNLSFFLANCRHQSSGVLAWGLHTLYDPVAGMVNLPNQYATSAKELSAWSDFNEPGYGDRYLFRSPFFIEKFFDLDYESTAQHMLSWYSATLASKKDFSFSRHTPIDGHPNAEGNYISMMNPMAYAYTWGNLFVGDSQFKDALNYMMNWVERLSGDNEHYMFPQDLYITNNRFHSSWMRDTMDVAVWFREMIPFVPEDIGERMLKYSDFVIDEIMGYDADRDSSSKFYADRDFQTAIVTSYRDAFSINAYAECLIALQEENDPRAEKFRGWLVDWTEDYGFLNLDDKLYETDYFPRAIALEMEHHLKMYRATGEDKYLDRVLELSDFSIYDFWEMESLLPSMTHAQKKYYESTWGSVQIVKAAWDAYFLDIERKTGVNPINDAWEKAGYTTKDIYALREEENYNKFMEKNRNQFNEYKSLKMGENAE